MNGIAPAYQGKHPAGASDTMVGDDEEAPVLTGFEYLAGNTFEVGFQMFDADDWELHSAMNIHSKCVKQNQCQCWG